MEVRNVLIEIKEAIEGLSTVVAEKVAGLIGEEGATFNNEVADQWTSDVTIVAPDFEGDLTGDVTGNVTGDVTGDVTGNVSGDVTGDLTGDVLGDVTGNVTGDLDASSGKVNIVRESGAITEPPTVVELEAIFGDAEVVGDGFVAFVTNTGGTGKTYKVTVVGTGWTYVLETACAAGT